MRRLGRWPGPLGDISSTRTVIYDPVADSWFGTGTKGDPSSEATWTLLRDEAS